jgi:hypothetical protein
MGQNSHAPAMSGQVSWEKSSDKGILSSSKRIHEAAKPFVCMTPVHYEQVRG